MEEKDTKVYTKELFFKDSGESIKVSIELGNVSPEKINMTQSYVKEMWQELETSVFVF